MSRHRKRLLKISLLYFVVIMGFAIAYFFFENQLNNIHASENPSKIIDVLDSVYFSVVTITTLGYGDITGRGALMRLLTAIEAVIGIILAGLLISSIWDYFTEKREIKTRRSTLYSSYALIQDLFVRHRIEITKLLTRKADKDPNAIIPIPITISDIKNVFEEVEIGGEINEHPAHFKEYLNSAVALRDDLRSFLFATNFEGLETIRDELVRLIRILDDRPFETTLLRLSELPSEQRNTVVNKLEEHVEVEAEREKLLDTLINTNQVNFYSFYRFKWSIEDQLETISKIDKLISDVYSEQ